MGLPQYMIGAMPVIENAGDEQAVAQATARSSARKLSKEELWKRYRWTLDAQLFALATTQWGFPAFTTECAGQSLRAIGPLVAK